MPASHIPVDSLLSRLRYPGPVRQGMAAWGADPRSGRQSAWVKWNGKEVVAEFTQGSPAQSKNVLSMQWDVSENGEAFLKASRDSSGPLDVAAAMKRFASISPADVPSFITLPVPPRLPRP